ncbi:MAG: hypothetical protein OEY52_05205 [Gammaproteobacteria bacterium]|nr:hypothetical protein [Gammaproteobacteria bacterium]
MKNLKLVAAAVIALVITGCTSYAGISKADKPGSYYIVTNTHTFGIHPGVQLCNSKGSGDLSCREVNVDD